MGRYLQQMGCILRPGSVSNTDLALRAFAGFLVETAPEVLSVAQVSRRHIEDYKPWLAALPGQNKTRASAGTIVHHLGTLRMFFVRIDEWGWDEAPPRVPMFHGDLPRDDHPLPKGLDDAAASKLLRALGDSAVRLHALASLLKQGQELLSGAVAQARDQDLTWDQIGALLGLTGHADARRYRSTTTARRSEPCTRQGRPSSPLPPPHPRAAPQPASRLTEGHPQGLALTPARTGAPWQRRERPYPHHKHQDHVHSL
jgi:hypothetical protein